MYDLSDVFINSIDSLSVDCREIWYYRYVDPLVDFRYRHKKRCQIGSIVLDNEIIGEKYNFVGSSYFGVAENSWRSFRGGLPTDSCGICVCLYWEWWGFTSGLAVVSTYRCLLVCSSGSFRRVPCCRQWRQPGWLADSCSISGRKWMSS